MKLEKFVAIPSLEILRGIKVTKDTELNFENYFEESNQSVKQELKNLRIITETSRNIGNQKIESKITIDLIEGDILLYDEDYGYCVPAKNTTVGTIEEAEEVIKAQKILIEKSKKEDTK